MMADAEGRLRAIRFGKRKMPDPITMPTTISVASINPSRRGRSFILFDGHGILSDIVVHARRSASDGRRRGADVMEGLGIFDAVLFTQRAIAGQDEFADVIAVRGPVVVAQQRKAFTLLGQLR